MDKRRRRKGQRLNDRVVEELPFKREQYTVWDLTVESCGVRVSLASKSCVISVRVGRRKNFATIGTITPSSPYEYLREKAIHRIAEFKRERLPKITTEANSTLRQTIEDYFAENPDLSDRTKSDYRASISLGFAAQIDQDVMRLTAEELLRLNREHLAKLAARDPHNKPPAGFWLWQKTLRSLRAVLNWKAAQMSRLSPWPNRLALRMKTPEPRTLPVELQTATGRRKLIEGLKAMPGKCARANRFLIYTGLRRRNGTRLVRANLLTDTVLELGTKTRKLRIPLSRQAVALLDKDAEGSLLHVTEWQLGKPLIRIFGRRMTSRGGKACVTPHDLRRYFKTVGTELGIDPTIMNLLVGHSIKGVDASYIAKIRLSVLRAAAQRIADEIDNPKDAAEDDDILVTKEAA